MKTALTFLVPAATLLMGCGLHLNGLQLQHGTPGSGKAKTETRAVGDFQRIELTGSPDVRWSRGDRVAVHVRADDNLIAHLKTVVEDGVLRIHFEGSVNPRTETVVTIVSPALSGARVTGSGNISLEGVAAKEFEAAITGSGDLAATGKADSLKASVTGSGDLDLGGLESIVAEAEVSGSGDIALRATETLRARITGSGDISYFGNPKVFESIAGSGEVRTAR